MTRPSIARIDLDALRSNYRLASRLHGGKVFAVIKANAYGHGAVQCAYALGFDADGFAVAFLEEALQLRTAGISLPILILEGPFVSAELDSIKDNDLWTVVHSEHQISMFERYQEPASFNVWLKIDTGMHRAGITPDALRSAHSRLKNCRSVADVSLMSHFSSAEERSRAETTRQIETFIRATAPFPATKSIANSAGLMAWPSSRMDWGRAGIMLYGADPFLNSCSGLSPVMSLESEIIAIRDLEPGDALGYGGRYVAKTPTRVGLVAMGYADGYPRAIADGTPCAVDGFRTTVIGRVSMDLLTVDLSPVPNAAIGSKVELWGNTISVNEVAEKAGTIAYELLCNVKRVRFEYRGQTAWESKS